MVGQPTSRRLAAATRRPLPTLGHDGSNPFDASWILEAPGRPNDAKVIDYFYRAAHQATGAAKALVANYYGAAKV